jgi:DNA-binding Lrp family transcriptional regulator
VPPAKSVPSPGKSIDPPSPANRAGYALPAMAVTKTGASPVTDQPDTTNVPPYVSFGTVLNQLERMERDGVPSRIDASYLVGMAGGTRSQFLVAMRSLGLVTEDNVTTPVLYELASSPDSRPGLLAEILRSRFPEIVALNGNATRGELEEKIAAYGLSNSDTRRKAMGFYIAAADYAGLSVSPHLRPAKSAGSPGAPRRARPAKKRPPVTGRDVTPPATPVSGAADMRRTYFELLISKAKETTSGDSDLLDRIERLVGVMEADETGKN